MAAATAVHFDVNSKMTIHEDGVAASGGFSSESLLEELEIELTEKVNQMRELADRLALRMESNFRVELLKLPKNVRTMSMRDFCVQHGGDVDEAMKQQAKLSRTDEAMLMPPPAPSAADVPASSRRKAAGGASARGGGKRPATADTPNARSTRTRTHGAVAATPSGPAAADSSKALATPGVGVAGSVAFTPRVHETPRLMQRGEVALSANGSPIALLDTVKARAGKRERPGTAGVGDAAPSVVLTLADGTEVDFSQVGWLTYAQHPVVLVR